MKKPLHWQDLYELGKNAFEDKRYNEAQRYFEELIKEKDNFADAYNFLGFIYHFNGKTNEAIGFFKKAIEINPRYTEASLNLAVVYNEIQEFEKANEIYAMAKDASKEGATSYLDPYAKGKLANMHAEIAAIYHEMGFYKEAQDEYKKAAALRPEFVDIRTSLGITYRDIGDFAGAIKEFEETLSIKPEYLPAKLNLGITYYNMGQLEDAKKAWLEILKHNPNDKKAKMYLNLLDRKKER